MYYKKQIGNNGEEIASEYLNMHGYKILDRNFNCWWGEIDIVALNKDELVFIEVKTRRNKKYGYPAEAVNKLKKSHLYKAIEFYLYLKNIKNKFIRIDVIEVYLNDKRYVINHIKNAIG